MSLKNDELDALVVVGTFTLLLEAQLAMTRLQAEGIECFIPNETTVRIMPHLPESQRISLLVKRSDLYLARELLEPAELEE